MLGEARGKPVPDGKEPAPAARYVAAAAQLGLAAGAFTTQPKMEGAQGSIAGAAFTGDGDPPVPMVTKGPKLETSSAT